MQFLEFVLLLGLVLADGLPPRRVPLLLEGVVAGLVEGVDFGFGGADLMLESVALVVLHVAALLLRLAEDQVVVGGVVSRAHFVQVDLVVVLEAFEDVLEVLGDAGHVVDGDADGVQVVHLRLAVFLLQHLLVAQRTGGRQQAQFGRDRVVGDAHVEGLPDETQFFQFRVDLLGLASELDGLHLHHISNTEVLEVFLHITVGRSLPQLPYLPLHLLQTGFEPQFLEGPAAVAEEFEGRGLVDFVLDEALVGVEFG